MHVIHAGNVNQAYELGMQHLMAYGAREQSRAGEVLVAPTPVTTVYERPWERVLFDPVRDANPFFHLMESVWMLAGSDDARWLDTYVSDFSSRFAEEDGHAHGAYGRRWRRWFNREEPIDQLLDAAQILRSSPGSRQAVIAMWDPAADLGAVKRDIPCNDMIMLRSRAVERRGTDVLYALDMTVLCRSNDAVWGAYGANAVHMSVMHEVLAGLCGMQQGLYYQVSNNFHVYQSILPRIWPPLPGEWDLYATGLVQARRILPQLYNLERSREECIAAAHLTLRECETLVQCGVVGTTYVSDLLRRTVVPMQVCHDLWKTGRRDEAMAATEEIAATDWRQAARMWMQRRIHRSASGRRETR